MVDLGGFPLDLGILLMLFRAAASDPEFQLAAVENDKWLFDEPDRVWAVAEQRGNADGTINDSLDLPDVIFPLNNENIREPLSNIARARIGHTIKLVGYCMTKGLIPHGIHKSHDAILRLFLRNSAKVIDDVAEADPYWNYRNRVLKLAHEEYIDFARLEQMSVEDVLTLRTATWGRQVQARDALFDATGQLARNSLEEKDFDKAVSEQIRNYRQLAAEVEDERTALRFKVHCEVGKTLLSAAGAGTAVGAVATLGTGIGAASAIVAGAYLALQQYQDLKPIADQLRQAESEFKDDLRFGIHNFYDQFP
jgi:hypothetical protein